MCSRPQKQTVTKREVAKARGLAEIESLFGGKGVRWVRSVLSMEAALPH